MALAPTQSVNRIPNQIDSAKGQAGNSRDEQGAKAQTGNAQNLNQANKKFKVKSDVWSLFTGFYSLLTYLGVVSNQVENFVAMGAKHITNADSLSDETLKADPEYKEYIESATAKPSIFKKILHIPGRLLGLTKENNKEFDGAITFYARALQTVFSPLFEFLGIKLPFHLPTDGDPNGEKTPFNFIAHRDLTKDKDGKFKDPKGHIRQWVEQVNPDPSVNSERKGLSGFWYNLNHPTTSRNALSFIFNVRNDIEVLRSKTPENIGAVGKMLNAVKILSSSVASVFAPAGSFLAWMFALTGKKLLITASSLWALVGAIHIPGNHALELAINICSAIGTSRKTGKPLKECLKDLGMDNFGKMFHGVLGGLAAVPSTFGSFARMAQVYKDTRYIFVPSAREFAKTVHSVLTKLGLAKNTTEKDFEENGANFVKGTAKVFRDNFIPILENLMNLLPFRLLLRTFLPVVKDPETGKEKIPLDVYKNILTDIIKTEDEAHRAVDEKLKIEGKEKYKHFLGTPTADGMAQSREIDNNKKNLIFGFIPKSESMMYLFKVFGAFEQWSVSVAYAFEKWLDKDIQQHAFAPYRIFDKVMGTINVALSLPNALIYGVTARLPQMLAGYYDIKQRIADSRNWKGKDGKSFDAMKENVEPLVRKLMNSSNPFFRFVGKSLNEDIVFNVYGKDVFKDPAKANDLITNFYEKLSFKQEYCIEAPAAVQYLRNLMKWSMNHFDFLHKRKTA